MAELLQSQERFASELVSHLASDYSESQSTTLIFGPFGCGKRTILREACARLGLKLREVVLADVPQSVVQTNIERVVSETNAPTVLYLSGLDRADSDLFPFLHQLISRRGLCLTDDALSVQVHVVVGRRIHFGGSETVGESHWICTQFNQTIEILPPAIHEHSALLRRMIEEEGWRGGIADSLLVAPLAAFQSEDWGTIRRLIKRVIHLSSSSSVLTEASVQEAVLDDVRMLVERVQYRGEKLTVNRVRDWIKLFGENYQSTAFRIAKAVCRNYFLGERELHNAIRELLDASKTRGEKVVVGRWQSIEKSANYVLNPIKNQADWTVVEEFDLNSAVFSKTPRASKMVLVDNFVGTGRTLCRLFKKSSDDSPSVIGRVAEQFPSLKIVILIVAGFATGIRKARELASSFENVEIYVGQLLDDRDRCFSDSSRVLTNADERDKMRECCREIAKSQLDCGPDLALGWGKLQSLVVLRDDVPNNTLPVIWKKSATWTPLFPAEGTFHELDSSEQ